MGRIKSWVLEGNLVSLYVPFASIDPYIIAYATSTSSGLYVPHRGLHVSYVDPQSPKVSW
jgi:hypothetical protein